VLDVVLIALVMFFTVSIRKEALSSEYLLVVSLAIILFELFAQIRGLYRSWRTEKVADEFFGLLGIWFAVLVGMSVVGFATKSTHEYSRVIMVTWAVLVPVVLGGLRFIYRILLRNFRTDGRNTRTLAFAGSSNAAVKMATHIGDQYWMGLRVLGVFDDRSRDRVNLGGLEFKGCLQKLVDLAKKGEVDIVYVTLPMHAERRIIHLVNQLSDTTASVYVVPDIFLFDLFNAQWSSVAGMPVVSVYESPFYGIDGWLKRAEDIVLGGLILLFISPVLLIIATGVKLTSAGPVFFKQHRYGLKGEVVEVWKFRSMTVCDNGGEIVQAKKNDTRITRFGAFLRRTSLDELPQFINVLQGQMSIVGPRPHAVAHNEQYRRLIHGYMLRHKVKPGITGWAQINGWRGETDTLDKMQGRVDCDLAYVRNWSLWFDFKIIFLTLFKGFISKNAY
jgi:putative colanic acid biosynthesis UDP-glucose lipid carrier transferase